nr:MAK10-like protein [Tanacetum cinerariifolium]
MLLGKLTTAIDVNAVAVNHTIYTSCIKQFWATVKVKTVNGEEQIQALVDKKKVIIIETSVRSDLHLEDAEDLCKYSDNQVEGMLKHKENYVTPSHTKKNFANMKRQGKDFSSKVIPLFETMMVQPQEDMGEDSKIPTDSHHTAIVTQPSTSSQPQQKQKFKKSKKRIIKAPRLSDSTHDVADEHVTTTSNDPLLSGTSTRVESSEDASLGDQEDASKQGRMIANLNADEGVALVDETQGRNDQDMFDTSIFDDEEVVAEKEWIKAFVPMDTELVKGSEKAVEGSKKAQEGGSKRAADKLQQEDAKRQRIEEENESAKLKRCLEIIPKDDDDVTIKATPLFSKSLTVVDYKIYKEGRKSFFKIIRANGGRLMKAMYLNEVFGYISLMKTKLLIKKLEDSEGSQIYDNSKKGLGYESYHAILPPPTGLFSPPKIDLSYSGLEEFQQPEFESYGPKSLSEDKLEKKIVVLTDAKIEFVKAKQQEKPVRKPIKYAEMYSDADETSKNMLSSYYYLWSEDPNQHLKDLLKLVDSLDLDVPNRERTQLRLFQFFLRDQASNWLERLLAGSISTWEDLTTCFLTQFFPPRRKSWNDPRDFAKPVKAISSPQDIPSTSDCRLIELENQVQRLMDAHLAPKKSIQVKKITSLCEICSGLHDTQYCIENPEQAFVDYISSRTNESGGKWNQLQMVMENGTRQSEEPKQTIEDEVKDLHLNLPVLKVLAHAPVYNIILDKWVETLELGKNGFTFIQGKMPTKMKGPELSTLPCKLRDLKPFDTFYWQTKPNPIPLEFLGDVEVHIRKLKLLNEFYQITMKKDPETPLLEGRGFLATANAVIDYRKAKIAAKEGITRSIFGVREINLGEEEAPNWTTLSKRESYKPRPSLYGIGEYTVLVVCQGSKLFWQFVRIVHCASGLSFLIAAQNETEWLQTFHNLRRIDSELAFVQQISFFKLYDEFEHFGQHKGENIHDYYVRFTKLINDMRHIKMTMPKIQLNSKFVNNILPGWGRVLGNNARGNVATGNEGAKNKAARNYNQSKRPQNSDYFTKKMLLMQAQENGVDLDEEQLLFLAGRQTNTFDDDVDEGPVQDIAQNEDNIFQADHCNTFNSDVDEAPTAQTMFMANLSSAALVYDEAGRSYDSDTLSECNPLSSGFSFLLAVATFFTGSGNFFCQWELITGSGNAFHLADLDNLQSCISSKSDHLPSASSSPLKACSRSSQVPDPSLEGSPSPQ